MQGFGLQGVSVALWVVPLKLCLSIFMPDSSPNQRPFLNNKHSVSSMFLLIYMPLPSSPAICNVESDFHRDNSGIPREVHGTGAHRYFQFYPLLRCPLPHPSEMGMAR